MDRGCDVASLARCEGKLSNGDVHLLLNLLGSWLWNKAGDRIRTGDVQLGKLTFYH